MTQMTAVRRCSRCSALRPATELLCQGTFEGRRCDWNLADEEIVDESGADGTGTLEGSPATPQTTGLRCPAGHAVDSSDLICPICGQDLGGNETASSISPVSPTCIGAWTVLERISESSTSQAFRVQRETDHQTGILTLHCQGTELDGQVYHILQNRIARDYIAEVLDFGTWEGRAFEVNEEIIGGRFEDLTVSSSDVDRLRVIVSEIASALAAFAEVGLRHRAIRPEAVRIRTHEPLDLVITDFGAARLSDLDLDLEAVPNVNMYTAPEAVMGGVAAASDWWGLGMILLHAITAGKAFDGVNQQVFLIHVLSNGAPIPDGLNSQVDCLLRGLLCLDRSQRWQDAEVRAWLLGNPPPLGPRTTPNAVPTGPAITLGHTEHYDFRSFTLSAPNHWNEAAELLERGAIASWADECGLDKKSLAALRLTAQSVNVPRDFRLGIALRLLNPSLPLLNGQSIIEPNWLIQHHEEGFELISGPTMDLLRRLNLESDAWLRRLAARANEVRQRAQQLQIELDDVDFRLYALSSSRPMLLQRWALRRAMLPDTEHSGLAGLLERKQLSDEDLHILLSAAPGQFRPTSEIIDEVGAAAAQFGLVPPSDEQLKSWLSQSRQEIFSQIDERIHGFARCGQQQLDLVADRLRLERRIPVSHAMLLLAVPVEEWRPPPNQEYLSSLLGFFEKRVVNAVLRGPLVRMKIGKWTPRVDLMELGVDRNESAALLERLLQRTDQAIPINPGVFGDESTTDSRLHRLVTQTQTHRRDTGVNGLYFGFPFLLRQDRDRTVRPHLAPVMLWPLRIDAETGRRGEFALAFESDREVILNPALEGLLGTEIANRWKQAADELLGRSRLTVADVMDAFGTLAEAAQRHLRGLPDLTTEVTTDRSICSAVLFHVTFAGQAIAKDLRVLHSTPPDGSALATLFRLTQPAPAAAEGPELTSEQYLLTASDPSQERAVALANNPPGLLIQGPPGTGKSQTIVNLVADTIGQGKSALIICQKLQALNVVKKRLVAEGLADRLIMVTDVHKDRRAILEEIRGQLAQLGSGRRSGAASQHRKRDDLVRQLRALEEEIDERYCQMHRHDDLCDLTYRQIIGELVSIEDSHGANALPEVVGLRRLFSDRRSSDVYVVAQACLSLGDLWLASNYEGNPLAAVRPIQFDHATSAELRHDFAHFVECESSRLESINCTTPGPELDETDAVEDWLQQHGIFIESASDVICQALRQYYSLFSKFRLGAEYLGLLERMIVIEEGWASPCIVSTTLEQHLLRVDKSTVEQIANECQSVADIWVAANYECSPLHALKEFSDPDSFTSFHRDWQDYSQAEAARTDSLSRLTHFWELGDPLAVAEWLEVNQAVIAKATDNLIRSVAPLLPLVEQNEYAPLVVLLGELDRCHSQSCGENFSPALESLVADLDKQALVATVANCQTVFESWLAADCDDSPLGELEEFQPTPLNDASLCDALSAFGKAEAARESCLHLPFGVAPGANLEAIASWLAQHQVLLLNVDDGLAAEVLRWQKLLLHSNGIQFGSLQTSLEDLIARLLQLNRVSSAHELQTGVSSLPLPVLQQCLADLQQLRALTPWWSYARLRQIFSRWQLKVRLRAYGIHYDQQFDEKLEHLLSAEVDFRQIREVFRETIEWIGADANAPSMSDLLTQLQTLRNSLARVASLISLLLSCPVRLDVPVICQRANSNTFRAIVAALQNEVNRQRCVRQSTQALQQLRPWFKPRWIGACRNNIDSQQSNLDRLRLLRGAWPTRAAYLHFRAGAGPRVREIFAALRERREIWQGLSKESRQQALEMVLSGHWAQSQKRVIESRFPVVGRLGTETKEDLAKAIRLVQRVEPLVRAAQFCPERAIADQLVNASTADDARQLLTQVRLALDFANANQQSQHCLAKLQCWFSAAWMQQREVEIARRQSSAAEVSAVTNALPTLAAFQELRATINGLLPATRRALEILSDERAHFHDMPPNVAGNVLQRIVLYHGVLGPKRRIELTVASLRDAPPFTRDECVKRHAVLSQVAPLVAAFESCPLVDERNKALATANPTAFKHLVSSASGAVERAKCRAASLATLRRISDRMQPEWQRKQEDAIRSKQSMPRLEDLQAILSALPQLEAYQAFRLRASKLTSLAWEVFEILAAKRQLVLSTTGKRGQILHDTVRREALLAWKGRLEQNYPALLTDQHEAATQITELSRLDTELKQVNRKLIVIPPEADEIGAAGQWEDITRYQGARALRLREFFKRAVPIGLKQLRPVWLMNPEVASQLLPLEPGVFDLVIYDEASQMPVEYAVPSLYRSQQVVISGDEKQMPPSSAFRARIDSDEEDAFDEELLDEEAAPEEKQAFEETWNRREIKDCPDLLHLGQAVLPKATLQIHYRSEYRELIAFSNAAYYNNELSVPSRGSDAEKTTSSPIEFYDVSGVYENQTNELEADKVVELLAKIWRAAAAKVPSIGIVTFNMKQADLIQEKLELKAEEDERFRRCLDRERNRQDDGEDMALFVKNVENVQGDERDAIIFSTTFGKNRGGTFRRNFGALGQRGGERRLNVAVTRARKRIMIVTSMPIGDISDLLSTRRQAQTPRDYLQAYLEYARLVSRGQVDAAHSLLARFSAAAFDKERLETARDGVLDSVLRFVASCGFSCISAASDPVLNVNCTVLDPRTGAPGIAIDCDPPMHPLLRRARARDVWRAETLRRSFSVLHGVSPRAWYHERAAEEQRLRTQLDSLWGERK